MTPDAPVTLESYAPAWLENVRLSDVAPRTLQSYQDSLRLHVLSWVTASGRRLAEIPLSEITRDHVRGFVVGKLSSGLKRNTVRIHHQALHALLQDAVDEGHLQANPAAEAKRARVVRRLGSAKTERQKAIHAFDQEELDRFLACAGRRTGRVRTILSLLAGTGMRPGEAAATRLKDVDLEGLAVHVTRAWCGGRGGRRFGSLKRGARRTVDISAELGAELRAWIALRRGEGAGPGDLLVPNAVGAPYDQSHLCSKVKTICAQAELPLWHNTYSLRHTRATLLLLAGAESHYVQQQLGHASVELTIDTYGSWIRLGRQPQVDLLGKLGAKIAGRAPVRPDDDEGGGDDGPGGGGGGDDGPGGGAGEPPAGGGVSDAGPAPTEAAAPDESAGGRSGGADEASDARSASENLGHLIRNQQVQSSSLCAGSSQSSSEDDDGGGDDEGEIGSRPRPATPNLTPAACEWIAAGIRAAVDGLRAAKGTDSPDLKHVERPSVHSLRSAAYRGVLPPCPFCGGDPLLAEQFNDSRPEQVVYVSTVLCSARDCQASVFGSALTQEEATATALARWGRRS